MSTKDLKILRRVLDVALETTAEIIEKKGALAFINNGFALVSIGANLPELASEVQFVRDNPEALADMKAEAAAKYSKYDKQIILQTARKIYSAVLFNVSTGLSIADDWKQYNAEKK